MGLAAVRGQEQATGLMKRSVAEGRIAHAYLFHGPDGVGKELAAKNFAKLLNCRSPKKGDACDFCGECLLAEKNGHPDVLWLRPSGKTRIIYIGNPDSLKNGTVRDFQRRVALKPFQGKWKVGIFVDADCMEEAAQNAILKTLEEPPAHTVIILVSSRPESLLPTILSRCQAVRFGPMREEELGALLRGEYGLTRDDAKALSRLTEGRMGEAVRAIRDERIDEARRLSQRLSSGEPGYWRAVAGPLGIFEDSLRKAREALAADLVARGLMDPPGAAGERRATGDEEDDEREKQAVAFIEGEMRRRHEEMLRQLLSWYRDLMVWNLTGSEELLVGVAPVDDITRAARGMSPAEIGERVKLIEAALEALWMNADFHTVTENLLVQLTVREA